MECIVFYPTARTDKLSVRELPDETLVSDLERNKVHCLNRTLALIWKHCDGATEQATLARLVQEQLGVADAAAVVQLGLDQLGRRHLLTQAPQTPTNEVRLGRRDVLKRLAAAAVVLPLAMTVTARRVAASVECFQDNQCPACPDGQVTRCVFGTCTCVGTPTTPTPPTSTCTTPGRRCTVNSGTGGCGSNCTCSGPTGINMGTCS